MNSTLRHLAGPAVLFASLWATSSSPAWAGDVKPAEGASKVATEEATEPTEDAPTINLFNAIRRGAVSVTAEGLGDGRMTLSVRNKTRHPLRVVLPPGLIASGTTGQFGGMGGMGGGMGGMGGMMGGMGGMGGGMGGMGGGMGGMGGMGGGMGGMGGGMGGGGMMDSGTIPASMGMMMLGQIVISLVGDRDSWDQQSLMAGMGGMGMGGMGGGMGGMGGMMGGMGGMGGGGMGGGFRSVPPTSLPFAALKPKQTRHLPTRLVSLSGPNAEQPVAMPAKGEKLRVGHVSQLTNDERVQKALERLAEDKAPQTVAQLVMWRVASNLDWRHIETLSEGWSNAQELALAQSFADQLDRLPQGESGKFLYSVQASGPALNGLSRAIDKALNDQWILGLTVKSGIPARPEGPGVACRIRLQGTEEAILEMSTSHPDGTEWTSAGKFTLPIVRDGGKFQSDRFVDAMAQGVLDRLVRATVGKGPKVKGKETYKVRIENGSPLVLNGIAVQGIASESGESARILSGISVAPGKSLSVPASSQLVEQWGLKKGVRVTAADLSGL